MTIQVEVVYALPHCQYLRKLVLNNRSTIKEAIYCSGLLFLRPDIDLKINPVGIFGQLVQLEDQLNHGDRVEIYRHLYLDPKDLRRKRAHCML